MASGKMKFLLFFQQWKKRSYTDVFLREEQSHHGKRRRTDDAAHSLNFGPPPEYSRPIDSFADSSTKSSTPSTLPTFEANNEPSSTSVEELMPPPPPLKKWVRPGRQKPEGQ